MPLTGEELQLVERSLRIVGLTSMQSDIVRWFAEFAEAASDPKANQYDLLRGRHPRLTKDQVRALGLRGNTTISAEFFARLNAAGQRNPVVAAQIISSTIMKALGARRSLAQSQSYGFDLRYRLVPSPMAAGPCTRAAACGRQVHTPESAPDLPLEGCDRLGQCACLWRVETY